jgi:peptide chain release factor subunit 1
LKREQEKDQEQFKGAEVVSREPLVDWLADNYKKFGATLQFVTNKSQQGIFKFPF